MNQKTKKTLNEGLLYRDLQNMVKPVITVDEYTAKVGSDSDIITLSFTVKGQSASKDLVDWFEKGYDFVLDSKISDGELKPGIYLVFVEINRRLAAPKQIVTLLDDLETVTGIKLNDWTVEIEDEKYSADVDELKEVIITSPHEYRVQREDQTELNEMRKLAQLSNVDSVRYVDDDLQKYKDIAGL